MRLRFHITGNGRPLLIQGPAWGPSSDYLRLTLAPLLEGVQVITYDPRNVGASPRVDAPDAQAVEHLVGDLEGLRRELGLQRFVLAGHSHGGFIAMAYAVRHAGNLDGLVLLNTTVQRASADERVDEILRDFAADPQRRQAVDLFRATGGRLQEVADDAALARQIRALMPVYFFDLDAMRRFAGRARDARPPSAAALARVPEELEPWVEEGLPSVDVPTLVVGGRYDVATTPAEARRIVDLLPRARLEIFERSGHHPWAEEPERFAAVLGAFLDDLDPRPQARETPGAAI